MNPHHHFVANNLFSGDFAKFNDWNENIYIELVDEPSQDERKNLKKEFDTYKYPIDFYAHCLDDGVQKVFDFLEQYKGCCTIPKSKRNIKLIYAAIITCQATRALYAEVLEFIGNSSEFKKTISLMKVMLCLLVTPLTRYSLLLTKLITGRLV